MKEIRISPSAVIVPLVTPHNLAELSPLIDHVVDGGVSAIFILGTTGETLKLDQKLRIEVIKQTARCLRKRVPLFVGISAANIAESLELMQIAQEVGAVAGVVVPLLWGGEGMQVMEELLSSSTGNFVFYNYPALTDGRFLPIELVKKFESEERILGIKDSSGDLDYFNELLKVKTHRNFKIYYGREQNLREVLDKGIDGIVPASANLDPHLASELWRKKGEGMWPQWEAQRKAILEAGAGHYLQGLKLLLNQRGLLADAKVR